MRMDSVLISSRLEGAAPVFWNALELERRRSRRDEIPVEPVVEIPIFDDAVVERPSMFEVMLVPWQLSSGKVSFTACVVVDPVEMHEIEIRVGIRRGIGA